MRSWRLLRCFASALLCAGLIAALGCEQSRDSQTPQLVLLYATCSLSREQLSPYDPTRSITPQLERFARNSAVLTRHQTESGQSGVAFASLFSGLQADRHGIYFHPNPLDPELNLIGEVFARGGFETYSWLEHPMADASLGYAQGIAPANRHVGMLEAEAPAFRELLEELRADSGRRAFVVTNFTRTHGAYKGRQLPHFCREHPSRCDDVVDLEHWRRLYLKHHIDLSWDFEGTAKRLNLSPEQQAELESVVTLLYEADVANLDRLFGQVVDAIEEHGLLDRSIVVFSSDHGEIGVRDNAAFRWTHGMQLAPEVLQVPMLIRAPSAGVVPGRYTGVTRSIDVLPTLAGLAGLPPVEGVAGVDLSAALRGEVAPPELVAWSHTAMLPRLFRTRRLAQYPILSARFPGEDPATLWVAARRGDELFELRRDDGSADHTPHLYRLDRDTQKREDLFDRADPSHSEMRDELERYRQRLIDAFQAPPEDEASLRGQTEERLRSLGYIE